MNRSRHRSVVLGGAALGALLTASSAWAQAAPAVASDKPVASNAGEVVVTAQRRSENIQRVPVAVTAVSADVLQQRNITDVTQLQQVVPSIQQQATNSQVGGINFSIRGIGTGVFGPQIEQSVGTVIDGVAMTRSQFAVGGFYDLDHVEVLEGPQGMLFGKNATAGVINIVTAQPKIGTYAANMHLAYGNSDSDNSSNHYSANGAINIPVSDNSALRIGGFFTRDEGPVFNVYNKNEDLGLYEGGVRAQYLWESGPLKVTLEGDFVRETGAANSAFVNRHDAPGGFQATEDALAGVKASPDNFDLATDGKTSNMLDSLGVASTVVYTLPNGVSLTNISSVRGYTDTSDLDTDFLPVDFLNFNHEGREFAQYSDELRLASPTGAKIEYQAGLYYLHLRTQFAYENGLSEQPLAPPLPAGAYYLGEYSRELYHGDSYAAFGQLKYHITDDLHVFAGARYTQDNSDYRDSIIQTPGALAPLDPPGNYVGRTSYDNVSYRVGVEYQVTPSVFTYATWARGYKGPTFDQHTAAPVGPEIPVDIEAGIKSTWLDHRLTVNLSAFRETFHGFQAQATVPGPLPIFTTLNAGELRAQGVEGQIHVAPVQNLHFDFNVLYNDAKYVKFEGAPCYATQPTGASGTDVCLPNGTTNLSGDQAAFAPKFSYILSGGYSWSLSGDLRAFANVDYSYRSSYNFTPQQDPLTEQKAFGMLGGSVGVTWGEGRWRVSLFARNLTDERVPAYISRGAIGSVAGDDARGGDSGQLLDQNSFRTIGVSLDYRM